jgi:tRNA pseudouridine55 synthase
MSAGVWLVDKPAGPTSHDIVARIRRGLPRSVKVGHAGTLDPFATGLLVVLTGPGTRLTPYLTNLDKTYLATVRLGAVSETLDPEGPITETGTPPDAAAVEAVLSAFVGEQRQTVPALSAVKVDGERLYKKARRGEKVQAPDREIVIHGIEFRTYDPTTGLLNIEVRCGKGTYLRQLAADIGERLGCGGYCAELRRTAVGHMQVAHAVPPHDVGSGEGIGARSALQGMPMREMSDDEAAAVVHGRSVPGDDAGPVALVHGPDVYAIGEAGAPGLIHPSVVLMTPGQESHTAAGTSSR